MEITKDILEAISYYITQVDMFYVLFIMTVANVIAAILIIRGNDALKVKNATIQRVLRRAYAERVELDNDVAEWEKFQKERRT